VQIIPAIDLKDNKCVRLTKGKDNTSEVFNENPIDQAKFFDIEAGQGLENLPNFDVQ